MSVIIRELSGNSPGCKTESTFFCCFFVLGGLFLVLVFVFFTVRAIALWWGKALIYSEKKTENNQNLFRIHCKRQVWKVHLENWRAQGTQVLVHTPPLHLTRLAQQAVGHVLETSLAILLTLLRQRWFGIVARGSLLLSVTSWSVFANLHFKLFG